MAGKHGIEETLDVVHGGNELALDVIERLQDGFDPSDVEGFLDKLKADAKFKQRLTDMYQGIEKVPAEIGDLSIIEGGRLGAAFLGYIPRWVKVLGKKK